MIGEVVNYRYEVLERTGEGPLFTVYKARDKVLSRLVALKVVKTPAASRTVFVTALCESYRRVGKLTHPGIVGLVDADCTGPVPLIAQEYVHGVNIMDRVRRDGAMSVIAALELGIRAAEILDYAHSAGVVHGDLKPSDIIVSPDGEVKINDFGVAFALAVDPTVAAESALASAPYQAPEITEGAPAQAASDIYSLGAALYEALTGRAAFEGPNAVAIALRKVRQPLTPIRQVNPSVPKSLSDVVAKCLESSPEHRYVSATALLTELTLLRDSMLSRKAPVGSTAPSPVAQPQGRYGEESFGKRFVLLILLFLGVVAIFLFGTLYFVGNRKEIKVPSFYGMKIEAAQDLAKKQGITIVDNGHGYSASYESGTVCQQEPGPDEFVSGGQPMVKVKISDGSELAKIPDLSGLSMADARSAAASSGFNVGKTTKEFSDTVPLDCVIRQDPESSLERAPNSSITLVLSKGPKPAPEQPATTSSTTEGNGESSETSTDGTERRFNVDVEVPADGEGGVSKSVRIVVIDDTGENTKYEKTIEPGSYTVPITAVGENGKIKIQVYMDNKLISTSTQ